MKKLFVSALASVVAFGGLTCAAEENIYINNIHIDEGTVYVESVNDSQTKNIFTLRMMKNDEGLTVRQKLYSVLQKEVEPGESIIFDIPIPDERLGVRGSGEYTVSIQTEFGSRDEEIFNYEDPQGVQDFIDGLNIAIESVQESDKAWETLEPLFNSETCRGVMFSKGISYDSYASSSDEVKKGILNSFYINSDKGLNAETFSEIFSEAMGLGIYNSGDREKGIGASDVKYNGQAANEKYISEVAGRMKSSYETPEDFKEGFKVAYGIVEVCKAKVDELKDCLRTFADETGECGSIISKIEKLSTMDRYVAYEYIADVPESQITTLEDLEDVLGKAYDAAVKNKTSNGGGGGGGGGGASGSVSNRAPVSGGSVSSATGSGTPDLKVEDTEELIFTDLTDSHWAAEAVLELKNKGIINGTETGAFEPDRYISREEFAKMLVVACDIEINGYESTFSDAKASEWYTPYIGAAADNGIVMGMGDGIFGVGEKITRQDMAVMAERAASVCGYTFDKVRDYMGFDDDNEVADYAKDSIVRFFESGIINGKENNRFDPLGNATRAEAAKIIYEAFIK